MFHTVIITYNEDVYKDPITDSGKTNKKGKLELVKANNDYHTVREEEVKGDNRSSELITYYKDGKVLVDQRFDEIRQKVRG